MTNFDENHEKAVVSWLKGEPAKNEGRTTPPKVTEQSSDERKGSW